MVIYYFISTTSLNLLNLKTHEKLFSITFKIFGFLIISAPRPNYVAENYTKKKKCISRCAWS
jgi:hypothetical protein